MHCGILINISYWTVACEYGLLVVPCCFKTTDLKLLYWFMHLIFLHHVLTRLYIISLTSVRSYSFWYILCTCTCYSQCSFIPSIDKWTFSKHRLKSLYSVVTQLQCMMVIIWQSYSCMIFMIFMLSKTSFNFFHLIFGMNILELFCRFVRPFLQ